MATLSTSALNWLADEWEKLYGSATLSGIVGDLAHKKRGGYHISRQDQPSGNYSVTRADDKVGPSDRASAIDMTMNTSDIKKCHIRLRNAWKNRANDPRMKYINAWNGWDGQGDAGRYDVVTGNVGTATPDHKWHIHLEIRRRYVNDMNAMRAILSILAGETASGAIEEDDDMTPDQMAAALRDQDSALSKAMRAVAWQYVGGGIEEGKSTLNVFNEMHQTIKALTAYIAAESSNPEELKAALAKLPTAAATADEVVKRLGGQSPEQVAEVLRGILGKDKAAALKAAL
jgi:hypothetical protein